VRDAGVKHAIHKHAVLDEHRPDEPDESGQSEKQEGQVVAGAGHRSERENTIILASLLKKNMLNTSMTKNYVFFSCKCMG
jgi:hypothetical protein